MKEYMEMLLNKGYQKVADRIVKDKNGSTYMIVEEKKMFYGIQRTDVYLKMISEESK